MRHVPLLVLAPLVLALASCGSSNKSGEAPAASAARIDEPLVAEVSSNALSDANQTLASVDVPESTDRVAVQSKGISSSVKSSSQPMLVAGTAAECEREVGREAAARLAKQCLAVSPATRPPCNVANSCALIRDEIARGCNLLDQAEAIKADCTRADGGGDAANVLRRYYAAISVHDYSTAYGLWSDKGKSSNQSYDEFIRGFSGTAQVQVTLGAQGRVEGAAGSRYVRLPVTVSATLKDGTRQRFIGYYTLRQAAPVPGADADAKRWHIFQARLSKG